MKTQNTEIQATRPSEFDLLKKHPRRAQCSKCGSKKSHTNPMARCWECKRKFCYDHIWGGQINDSMGQNEEIRDICDSCKKAKGYRNL
jgi:hypothetical protein